MEEEGERIGKIAHFYPKIGVSIIDIEEGSLEVGDTIRVKGTTTDFTQKVDSMEVEHKKIQKAKKGDSVGLKVKEPVRQKDLVYRVTA